jgi:hypothetical protein
MDTQGDPRPDSPPILTTTHAHNRRRERGRRLIARLAKLVATFPEFRTALLESIDLVQYEINRCPESDRQSVLHAIHLGAWTIDEIREETRLTRAELQKHLDQLLALNTIIRKESQEKNKFGGRPKILWLPAPNHQPDHPKITPAASLIVDRADVVVPGINSRLAARKILPSAGPGPERTRPQGFEKPA